ncbi:MAG: hypothetical protein ACREGH_02470 [Minisyncoccia bacterium]
MRTSTVLKLPRAHTLFREEDAGVRVEIGLVQLRQSLDQPLAAYFGSCRSSMTFWQAEMIDKRYGRMTIREFLECKRRGEIPSGDARHLAEIERAPRNHLRQLYDLVEEPA